MTLCRGPGVPTIQPQPNYSAVAHWPVVVHVGSHTKPCRHAGANAGRHVVYGSCGFHEEVAGRRHRCRNGPKLAADFNSGVEDEHAVREPMHRIVHHKRLPRVVSKHVRMRW